MPSTTAQYQSLNGDDDLATGSSTLDWPRPKPERSFFQPVIDASNTVVQKCLSFVRTNAGLLLVAASQGFSALMNVSVKKLNSLDYPVPALELVAVRMGITLICCLAYLLWKKVPDPYLGPKGVRHLLVLRGFSGFFGVFGMYYSLQYLSLSDATVLTFLIPLATAVSGFLFLRETLNRREALAGVLSLIGVIMIARPEAIFGHASASMNDGHVDPSEKATPEQRLRAVGVALLGVLGGTVAYTSIRAIGKRAHTLHSMSYFSLWCVITSTVGMLALGQEFVFPTRLEWLALLMMIGIFGFCAQVLLTMGLQRETAGRGAMAIYVQIIFATIFERIFFHTTPSALSIIGTLIIMGSAVYVTIIKQTKETAETSESTDSEVAFDLELGVAEPERQRFLLAQDNASRGFLQAHGRGRGQGQDGWKTAGMGDAAVGMGMEGLKSQASFLAVETVRGERERRRGEDDELKGEGGGEGESLVEALGFTDSDCDRQERQERYNDDGLEDVVVFDVGDSEGSPGSSSRSRSSSSTSLMEEMGAGADDRDGSDESERQRRHVR